MVTFEEIIIDEIRKDLRDKDLDDAGIDLSNHAELMRNIRDEVLRCERDFPKALPPDFDLVFDPDYLNSLDTPALRGNVTLLREIVAGEIEFIARADAAGKWGDQRQYDREDRSNDDPDDPF